MTSPEDLPHSYTEAILYDKKYNKYIQTHNETTARKLTVIDLKRFRNDEVVFTGPVGEGNLYKERLKLDKEYDDILYKIDLLH